MRRKIMIIGVVAWLALPGVLAAQMQGGGMHGSSGGMMGSGPPGILPADSDRSILLYAVDS